MREAVLVQPATARAAWLASPTLWLCVAGVLLPNALSLGAELAGIGAPPRTAAIIAYATLALAARIVHPAVTIALYVAIAAYDAISTIALLFNLAPSEIGLALHLGSELNLFASPLYIGLTVGSLVIAGLAIALLTRRRELLRRANPFVMMGLAAAFAVVDFVTNTSAHYEFGTLYGAGKPMVSATEGSGFHAAALAAKNRNVVLIVVEALGHFADPARQRLLLAPFADPALAARYDVKFGTTTYYGSTTAGEMRELCNTREPYQKLLEGEKLSCLPEQMAAKNYRTVAMHNFTSAFFGRYEWYPKLGFETRLFSQDVGKDLTRKCGGPFRGPCDVDLVPVIRDQLKNATKPTFFYWMTLSTHVPIMPHEGTPRLGCERGGGKIGQVEVCYMTELWMDLFERIAKLTTEVPDTEILLVGDHAPPLWSKAGRELFTPGQVSWIRLIPRGCDGASARPECRTATK